MQRSKRGREEGREKGKKKRKEKRGGKRERSLEGEKFMKMHLISGKRVVKRSASYFK